jgi:hypothetical protein
MLVVCLAVTFFISFFVTQTRPRRRGNLAKFFSLIFSSSTSHRMFDHSHHKFGTRNLMVLSRNYILVLSSFICSGDSLPQLSHFDGGRFRTLFSMPIWNLRLHRSCSIHFCLFFGPHVHRISWVSSKTILCRRGLSSNDPYFKVIVQLFGE